MEATKNIISFEYADITPEEHARRMKRIAEAAARLYIATEKAKREEKKKNVPRV